MTPDLMQRTTGCSSSLAERWAAPVSDAMQAYDISSAARQAAFLAQIGHESGGFIYTTEIWGPTTAQTGYEGRQDLGNTEPGDGSRFRGRGLIQITGRANYTAASQALGADFVNQPELLAEPEWAARSAGWFWARRGLNALADQQLFSSITQRINGGQNGAADRLTRYHLALAALNGAA